MTLWRRQERVKVKIKSNFKSLYKMDIKYKANCVAVSQGEIYKHVCYAMVGH